MIKKGKDAFTLAESAAHARFVNNHRRCAFTLAESAAHAKWLPKARHAEHTCHAEANVEASPKHGRKATFWGCFAALNMTPAFTLAETLITLLVIGVVAALTIPALMQQIGDYTLEKQRTVFEKKFAEGLRQMRVDEKLAEKYATTADFVNAMQKYFKISAVCDKDNLTNCFAETFTAKAFLDGKETASKTFMTSNIKTSQNLVENSSYDTDVMGIVFSDGVKMLLTYNAACEGITSGDTQGNLYQCFGYVADVNSNKSPNQSGKDIVSNLPLIRNFGLSFEIINNTVYSPGATVNGVTWSPTYVEELGADEHCLSAQNFCKSLGGSLPDESQLEAIAAKLYPCTPSGDYYECSPDTTNELWSVVGNADLWSSVTSDSSAYHRDFSDDYGSSYMIDCCDDGNMKAMCVK